MDFCFSQSGERGRVEFRQFRKVQEVLSQTISCGLPRKVLPSRMSPYVCFSLKRPHNFLFLAAGLLHIDSSAWERKNNLQSFSLLLVQFGQVTLCDPPGGLLIRKREEDFFLGRCPIILCWNDSFKLQGSWIPQRWEWRFFLDSQTVLPTEQKMW